LLGALVIVASACPQLGVFSSTIQDSCELDSLALRSQ
jgi:hypothetical protein